MVKEVSGPAPTRSWDDTTEGGREVATEDRGSRQDKEITGRTDPVARRGKAPPDPVNEACGLTGNVGKTGGTIPPGAPVKEGN